VRITVGRFSTEEEIDYAVAVIEKAVAKLREGSAQWLARDSATG
jgi:cysteine desulfurase